MREDPPEMLNDKPLVLLRNYQPPAWWIDTVHLDVEIESGFTTVSATLAVRRNPDVAAAPLTLDGEDLQTLSVQVNQQTWPFVTTDSTLTLTDLPDSFTLHTVVRITPEKNTSLSGLYRSRDGYFTQCEAQGFRRITWFTDRPDVMSTYTVTLHADEAAFPVLLSNGNPVDKGQEAHGRHWARWHDPFRKPCYLFALVVGKLDVLTDSFVTASGRTVHLSIYAEPGKLDQCGHAMFALQKSMRWDEARFGLECDLDHYMIVAVGDFNSGAMENKGLNIFNTRYVLARPDVATDSDFENIERVVAHEYFHNWTGNRVTCRDWFQLSLKEGLTVFRDQEFGADVHERQTARIREVRNLRAAQFPEDAGPMAHPVRPASYLEIRNFYTATVYEKGAEVVRMIQTLIGTQAFRLGMDEYFRRHDGQAVTCEDFVAAMAAHAPAESGFDPLIFMRWYKQAGTPRVWAEGCWDADKQTYTLTCTQASPRNDTKTEAAPPLLIPIRAALFDQQGQGIPGTERTLRLSETRQSFVWQGITDAPTPSLLRDFSAPVILDFDYTPEQLTLLMAHETDAFSAWEAGQRLASTLILDAAAALAAGQTPVWPDSFVAACRHLLRNPAGHAPAFIAETLGLPLESTLAEMLAQPDPDTLHAARNSLRRHLAEQLENDFLRLYTEMEVSQAYAPGAEQAGRRALRNQCLAYLAERDTPAMRQMVWQHFSQAKNMTDQFAALAILANITRDDCPERHKALDDFYQQWQHEALVVDKWFAVQASSRRTDTLDTVTTLLAHPDFTLSNPNKVYALLRSFGTNLVRFHAADGRAYAFLAGQILALDKHNPQVAARLARCFDRWRKFDITRRTAAQASLTYIQASPNLSADVREVVSRALSDQH